MIPGKLIPKRLRGRNYSQSLLKKLEKEIEVVSNGPLGKHLNPIIFAVLKKR